MGGEPRCWGGVGWGVTRAIRLVLTQRGPPWRAGLTLAMAPYGLALQGFRACGFTTTTLLKEKADALG